MTIEEDFEEALRKAHKYRIKCRESTNESSRTKGDAVIFTSVANALGGYGFEAEAGVAEYGRHGRLDRRVRARIKLESRRCL